MPKWELVRARGVFAGKPASIWLNVASISGTYEAATATVQFRPAKITTISRMNFAIQIDCTGTRDVFVTDEFAYDKRGKLIPGYTLDYAPADDVVGRICLRLVDAAPPPTSSAPTAAPAASSAQTTVAPTTVTPTTTAAPVTTRPTSTTAAPHPAAPTQTLIGSGNSVTVQIELAGGLVLIKMYHGGSRNFIARLVDAEGREGSSFVNEIGQVNGSTIETVAAGRYFVKVQADGPWRLDVDQPVISGGQDVPAVFNGQGLTVIGPISFGGGVRITYEHFGRSNFIVVPYLNRGRDVVNEIGHVGGATTYRPGAGYYLRVVADGQWTIAIGPL